MQRCLLLFVILLTTIATSTAQSWLERLEDYKIKPVLSFQSWLTHTHQQEVYDDETRAYQKVDDRLNFEIRRIRFGAKAQPYPNLRFVFVGAVDFVGRDVLSAMQGGSNNGNLPSFGLWDAYAIWRLRTDQENLNLVLGYFATPFGRESISSAFNVPSFEKAWTQNYGRRHLTGRGPGRTMGLSVGGLVLPEGKKVGFQYTLGIYNPAFSAYGGNSTGSQYSPLLAGRFVLYIGDPEQTQYNLGHKVNYFNKRKGFSLGLAAARQAKTDFFVSNSALGVDFLFNWEGWNIDGDFAFLYREGERSVGPVDMRAYTSQSQVGHIRLSYNLKVASKYILEPTIMWMQFEGAMELEEQVEALSVGAFAGKDRQIDIGLNWYLHPGQVRFGLHYVLQDGEAGALGNGVTFNNYFSSGAGAIKRGNYLGAEVIVVF